MDTKKVSLDVETSGEHVKSLPSMLQLNDSNAPLISKRKITIVLLNCHGIFHASEVAAEQQVLFCVVHIKC